MPQTPDPTHDDAVLSATAGPALPSRRYACEGCGQKWRRNNSPVARAAPPVCPRCRDDIMRFKRIEKMIPKIIYLKNKYPEL